MVHFSHGVQTINADADAEPPKKKKTSSHTTQTDYDSAKKIVGPDESAEILPYAKCAKCQHTYGCCRQASRIFHGEGQNKSMVNEEKKCYTASERLHKWWIHG